MVQPLVSQETSPQTGRLLAELEQQFTVHLVALIRAGQAAGEVVQGDAQELATLFLAAIQGHAITQFNGGLMSLAAYGWLLSPAEVRALFAAAGLAIRSLTSPAPFFTFTLGEK